MHPVIFPMSWGQRALWFLDRLTPGGRAYVIAGAGRVSGELDEADLRQAVELLVARQPALRTRLRAEAGRIEQAVAAPGTPIYDFEVEDGGDWPEAELAARVGERAFRPFDLERGPLFRVGVVRRPGGPLLWLAVHHAVADFWSLGVILRELGALYGRKEPALPAAPAASYGEWSRRQVEWLESAEGREQLEWWRHQLAGVPAVLDLPVDHPRPAMPTEAGGAVSSRVDGELFAAVRRLGRRQGATPAVTLLAVFAALLHRYSGQERVAVGMPTTGRRSPAVAEMVGYLVNPVTIVSDFRGAPTGSEALARVRAAAQGAFDHQDYPLGALAERLHPERAAGASPLFQAVFVLQKGRRSGEDGLAAITVGESGVPLDLGGLTVETVGLEEPAAQFDLSVVAAELAGALVLRWQYSRDLFEPVTVTRMAAHFHGLLEQLAGAPERFLSSRVAELPLLSAAERHQVRLEWGGGGSTPVPHKEPGLGLLAAAAAACPDAVAVVQQAAQLSYGELHRRAYRLADRLVRDGVEPDDTVGLFLTRSPELVTGMLAVLSCGAAYLPLDVELPAERLRYIREDAKPRRILTLEQLGGTEAGAPPLLPALPEAGAYRLYTSGSTGRPKGVVVPRRALANLIRESRAGFDADDVFLSQAHIGFDVGVLEIFRPLALGARLVLAPPGAEREARVLQDLCREQGITSLFLTPSAFESWLAVAQPGGLPSLRKILTGAEAVPEDLPDRIQQVHPELEVENLYGPTEAAVYVLGWPCTPPVAWETGPVPVGRPQLGAAIVLFDRAGQPVPAGVPGEIAIGGPGLARGYGGRPELTAERFVPHPWGEAGERLYRTGDLGRFRRDGAIEFLGRIDHQVKLRGFRIELGEIEAVLAEQEGIRRALVMLQGEGNAARLVAYLEGTAGDESVLRRALAARLPEYMVPAAFVALDAFPLLPTGKVDRSGLPAAPRVEQHAGSAPRTPLEELLALAWAELLGLEQVGVDDDFFALGGHSLLAAQLLARVRETTGTQVPLRRLFAAPTVAALAREIEAERRAGHPALPAVTAVPREPGRPLPLSPAQERLWFLDRLGVGAVYNVPLALEMTGELDPAALAGAIRGVMQRHESLRTTFAAEEGQPVQWIAPRPQTVWAAVDLEGLPPERQMAVVQELAEREAVRRFDLAAGPLLRTTLLRLAPCRHVLLLNLHHVISDGASLEVLLRETAVLYAAAVAGGPAVLSALPVQYADFALWQRRWLESGAAEEHLDFWRRRLAGIPGRLELPTDRPRPASPSHRGAVRAVRLPAATAVALRGLGRQTGATLFMSLLAAVQAVLGRWAGQERLAVGSPAAGRTRPELEGLIGFFVNLLVLGGDLGGRASYRELLRRTRDTALAGYEHQDLPFDRLVEALQPERDPAWSPLFQVLFVLQTDLAGKLRLPGLGLARWPAGGSVARYDLSLSLVAGEGELSGALEYSTDLFDAATMERWWQHVAVLAGRAIAEPDRPLAELPLVTAAERHQLLQEWSSQPLPAALPGFSAAFARQAGTRPDAVALVGEEPEGEVHLSWMGLESRVLRLSGRLRELGVATEGRVGIYLDRSLAMIAGTLAVLRAGGAYLPLDPGLPAERLAFLLREAEPRVVLTREAWRHRLPAFAGSVLPVDGALPASTGPARVVPDGAAAYVLYTSGSTGTPKGVVVPHRALDDLVRCFADRVVPGDVVLFKASLGFDVSLLASFVPLVLGARISLAAAGAQQDTAALVRQVAEHQVTSAGFPPSAFLAFLGQLEETEGRSGTAGTSVARWTAGAEALPEQLIVRLFSRWPATRLDNFYGPTETTVYVTASSRRAASTGGVSIGRPRPGAEVLLLDAELSPVPAGLPGEICVGGGCVARGYFRRPDLTAEKFVPHPWGAGDRLYRTGDLARFSTDGSLEFLGRRDQQVKIRGFRVELGEIEALLRQEPGVRDAAAVLWGEEGDRRLVAYVAGSELVPEDLRSALAARLPAYMVPAAVAVLAALPLGSSGKVDRRALPEPDWADRDEAQIRRQPANPIEELLAELMSRLLRVERVGVEDDFFRLGGHSLLAVQLGSRIRETLGVQIPLARLFASPTVAALAQEVEAARADGRPPLPPIGREGDDTVWPLSFAQERLWFLDRLDPGNAAYNLAGGLRLRGRLDPEALAAGLDAILARHAALRVRFEETGEGPVQRVQPAEIRPLPQIDLAALAAPGREGELGRLARAEASRGFDLGRGPVLRRALIRLAPEEHVLALNLHHIAGDGWSLGLFVRELTAHYRAFCLGGVPAVPDLPVTYGDYARWQRRHLAGEWLERELGWWRQRLAGAPTVLELPADRPPSAAPSPRGGTVSFALPAHLVASLWEACGNAGVTPFMALLAAFGVLLGRLTGLEDLLVGSPVAGRERGEIEPLLGFFVNTLVLRLEVLGRTGSELLAGSRDAVLASLAHRELPFHRLVEELAPDRESSRPPLVQVMFAFQSDDGHVLDLPGLTAALEPWESTAAKLDLTLSLQERRGGLHGSWEYSRDRFDRASVQRLSGYLETLLEAIAEDSARPVGDFPLLRRGECHQLLVEWNERGDLPVAVPDETLLHQAFWNRAARRPGAVALVTAEGTRWTYGELAARAGDLAARLSSLGVAPEVRVGLFLERSPELVAAALGILRAGGAYVPLDAGYPAERLAAMLEDSGAAVLVTRAALAAKLPAAVREGRAELLLDGPGQPENASGPPCRAVPDNLAYLIYTSGSTGRPKGVAITHRNAVDFVRWSASFFADSELSGVLGSTSVCFDMSVFELFGTLSRGGTLLLVENALALAHWPQAGWPVTLVNTVPSAFDALVRADAVPASVVTASLGGEPLRRALAAETRRRTGVRRLLNFYGPSEDTTFSTFHQVDLDGAEEPTIGRTLPGSAGYVLDAEGRLLPQGVPGELHLGGAGLARGYLGRPELTAEKFVPDAWSGRSGARLYRTGDQVRQRTDGELVYLGRRDHQVKIRGFRIELQEIEVLLRREPGVRDVVVGVVDGRLAAWVETDGGTDVLRASLVRQLPRYMVPASLQALESLPRTPNGKVDRAALPVPEWPREESRPFVPPQTPVEEAIAEIWEEVLGIDRARHPLGIHDDFFERGGHSLLATQVLLRIEAAFGVGLRLQEVFATPTVAGLAVAVAEHLAAGLDEAEMAELLAALGAAE